MRRVAATKVAGRSDDQVEAIGYGAGTVSFHWKVSSQAYSDFLLFYIDGSLQDVISGDVDWEQKQYTVNTEGSHVFRWEYVKDGGGEDGDDLAWVDYLQWTGESEPPETESSSSSSGWQVATYTYDPAGRRIAKSIDGTVAVKYGAACPELVERDGPQCIAEYDVNDALLRKFIYGPGIDQPICMIEAGGTYSGTYYYHFDGLGSVVALSDDDGDTVVTYEYDAFGLPASSDPNHPNPFLFTGRRFDVETGLYHYRARAYNPYIGRFLQLDPAQQGMNWYAYCGNSPVNLIDPSGCEYLKPIGDGYYLVNPPLSDSVAWAATGGFDILDFQRGLPGARAMVEGARSFAGTFSWVVNVGGAVLAVPLAGGATGSAIPGSAAGLPLDVVYFMASEMGKILDACNINSPYRVYIEVQSYEKQFQIVRGTARFWVAVGQDVAATGIRAILWMFGVRDTGGPYYSRWVKRGDPCYVQVRGGDGYEDWGEGEGGYDTYEHALVAVVKAQAYYTRNPRYWITR